MDGLVEKKIKLERDGPDEKRQVRIAGPDEKSQELTTSRPATCPPKACFTRHEMELLEEGEAGISRYYDSCIKKFGHSNYISVEDFQLTSLPSEYQKMDIFKFIKAAIDLTVRVLVNSTSAGREVNFPNTEVAYPCYDLKESSTLRTGTGRVEYIIRYSEKDKRQCLCQKCRDPVNTPSLEWGEVGVFTATHVVFDDSEARATLCRLFYEKKDSPLINLDGVRAVANINEDTCILICATCDLELLSLLQKMLQNWEMKWNRVRQVYKSADLKDKPTIIVSHPHGRPMMVSVGRCLNRDELREGNKKCSRYTRYTYNTCTCPGSSGASVIVIGSLGGVVYAQHLHTGFDEVNNNNFSGSGEEDIMMLSLGAP